MQLFTIGVTYRSLNYQNKLFTVLQNVLFQEVLKTTY